MGGFKRCHSVVKKRKTVLAFVYTEQYFGAGGKSFTSQIYIQFFIYSKSSHLRISSPRIHSDTFLQKPRIRSVDCCYGEISDKL